LRTHVCMDSTVGRVAAFFEACSGLYPLDKLHVDVQQLVGRVGTAIVEGRNIEIVWAIYEESTNTLWKCTSVVLDSGRIPELILWVVEVRDGGEKLYTLLLLYDRREKPSKVQYAYTHLTLQVASTVEKCIRRGGEG